MVEQCLAGQEQAWERLYRRCHPRLHKSIEILLGPQAADVHLVEEIAARVWYALLRDDCRLLAAYDADRDSSLEVFLMGLARIEILRYMRSEQRRRCHERIRGRKRLEEKRISDWQLAAMIDEFAATLTPGERQFMEKFLTGNGQTEEDSGLDKLSATNFWQRRHRIRFKLNEFLKEP